MSSSDDGSDSEDWYQKCFGQDPYKSAPIHNQSNYNASDRNNVGLTNLLSKPDKQYNSSNKSQYYEREEQQRKSYYDSNPQGYGTNYRGHQNYRGNSYGQHNYRGNSSGYQNYRGNYSHGGNYHNRGGRDASGYPRENNFDPQFSQPEYQKGEAKPKPIYEPPPYIPVVSELKFHTDDEKPLTEGDLKKIDLDLRPEELVRDMDKGPFYLMLETATSTKFVSAILKFISCCSESSDEKALISLFSMVNYNKTFIQQNLKCFLEEYTKENVHIENLDDLLFLLRFLLKLQVYQPASVSETLSELNEALEAAISNLVFYKKDITLEEELFDELQLSKKKFIEGKSEESLREEAFAERLHCYEPLVPIFKMKVLPTINELLKEPFLRPNLEKGKFWDFDHYADVHYRLIREEMLHFLRKAVKYYQVIPEERRESSTEEYNFYYDLKYFDTLFEGRYKKKIIFKFNNEMLHDVDWENSRRLTYGTLLAFSNDQFTETIIYGSVSKRNVKVVKQGYIEVEIFKLSPDVLELIMNNTLEMIEVPIFTVSCMSPLKVLTDLEEDSLALKEYVIYGKQTVSPPNYLEDSNLGYDLRPLFQPLPRDYRCDRSNKDISYNLFHGHSLPSISYDFDPGLDQYNNINILNDKEWPSYERVNLDMYQYNALKAGLTKELALIQGPPGTGKTYIGLRLVQCLLHNKSLWGGNNSPILIACFKNHALDQFLEGILPITTNLVRLGAQCKSEKLAPYVLPTIMEIASNTQAELTLKLDLCTKEIRTIQKTLKKKQTSILPMSLLEEFMRDEHKESFKNDKGEMLIPEGNDYLLYWLGEKGSASCDLTDESIENVNSKIKLFWEEKEKTKQFKQLTSQRVEVEADVANLYESRDYDLQLDRAEEDGYFSEEDNDINAKAAERELKFSDMMQYHEGAAPMTFPQVAKIKNVWRLSLDDRWRLYFYWLRQLELNYTEQIKSSNNQFNEINKEISKSVTKQKEEILSRVDVIGLTTTAAALQATVLEKVRPKIVIIEEAAEVLEIHTLCCFSSFAKHLIMIGDHKQLRPHVEVQELGERYKLDISLFERLVNNGLRSYSLITQHRMKPCIAYLLTPHIYPMLENHADVMNYERIKGVYDEMYFFSHKHRDSLKPGTVSYYNPYEAQFLIELCKYLLYQLYKPSEITIMATYTGQVKHIQELAEKTNTLKDVKITTVDNYQGEENEIILLSLVRSETKLGFLKIPNRVCVALSRARKGFYCIGDFSFLARNSDLWSNILKDLISLGKTGFSLRLECQNHSSNFTMIRHPDDFKKQAYGGCNKKCEFVYPDCKHLCPLECHIMDKEHKELKCQKECERVPCSEGHKCPKVCYMTCGDCEVLVTKQIEKCRHKVKMFCSKNSALHTCKNSCSQALKPCNHPCKGYCYQTCKPCKQEVYIRCQRNHAFKQTCSTLKDVEIVNSLCSQPCKQILSCGHTCKGTCGSCYQGRFHVLCDEPCSKTLLCGDPCEKLCYESCSLCRKKCRQQCCHGVCPRICGIPCANCHEKCNWTCQHFECTLTCSELCDRPACDFPCSTKYDCHHFCPGYCGEPCIECLECHPQRFKNVEKCSTDRIILLEDCGHVFNASTLQNWLKNEDLNQILCKKCPECDKPIQKNTRFGNIIKNTFTAINEIIKHVFGTSKKNLIFRETLCSQIDEVFENQWFYFNWFPHFKDLFINLKNSLNDNPSLQLTELSIIQNFIEISKLIFEFVNFLNGLGRKEFPEKTSALALISLLIKKMCEYSVSLHPVQMKYIKREVKRMIVLYSLIEWKKQLGDSINYGVQKDYSSVIKQMFDILPFDTARREKVMKGFKKTYETQHGEGFFNEGERLKNPPLRRVFKPTTQYWEYCPLGHWKYKSKHNSDCSHCS